MPKGYHDSPNMSDTTIIMSVEDLINIAMGPSDVSIVNFKMIQTVLHILARQLRMLKTQVEIRISEPPPPQTRKKLVASTSSDSSSPSERAKSQVRAAAKGEKAAKAIKEKEKTERGQWKDRKKEEKDKENAEEMDSKDREKEKIEKAANKKEDIDKMNAKEKEKYLKEKGKDKQEQEKLEKVDVKKKEKGERAEVKEREKMDANEKYKYLKEKAKEEKEREKLDKMDTKVTEREEKEKEKSERAEAKDKKKVEKMNAKEKEKAREEKEREKMDAKEREMEEKTETKEKEKLAKLGAKERDKYEKDKAKEVKEIAKPAKAGISIQEKDMVLIVENEPTTRADSRTRVGSIEVVTISQFELLKAAVEDLKEKAGPLPFPSLPDNEKLRSELVKGSASLSDTMQAMQLSARVQAAETAIGRFAGLLTQLTSAGALPADVATKLEDVKAEMDAITERAAVHRPTSAGASVAPSRKSVAIDPMLKKSSDKMESRPPSAVPRPSITSRAAVVSKASVGVIAGVSHIELDEAIRSLRDVLHKNVNAMTSKATMSAEAAAATAKGVAEKLDVTLRINTRISSLYSLVADYAEQLTGFEVGLATQLQSFGEQMTQMRDDLKGGMALLETVNNNAETAAVFELTERYEELVIELDRTINSHKVLTGFQGQLGDQLRSLLECVEMLREQKADRDEVFDGLRDKADNSHLAGLLSERQFATSRSELEMRLDFCYDKFRKQEHVWMGAIKDLSNICDGKAEIMQLMSVREDAQQQLRDIQKKLEKLAIILGNPKAAMLTRQLSKGARCGACQVPAIQEPLDSSYGKPPPLPGIRVPPAGEEEPCVPEWKPPQPVDERDHACHRWVGGSHTLLTESVVRVQAGPVQLLEPPTERYAGYGTDGRLYMMEGEVMPCVECNMIPADTKEAYCDGGCESAGAGDTGTYRISNVPSGHHLDGQSLVTSEGLGRMFRYDIRK